MKVLPTQPDTPSIPEEDEDDEETKARTKAEEEGEGVEVGFSMMRCQFSKMFILKSEKVVLMVSSTHLYRRSPQEQLGGMRRS